LITNNRAARLRLGDHLNEGIHPEAQAGMEPRKKRWWVRQVVNPSKVSHYHTCQSCCILQPVDTVGTVPLYPVIAWVRQASDRRSRFLLCRNGLVCGSVARDYTETSRSLQPN
jgi:hypothetical protein